MYQFAKRNMNGAAVFATALFIGGNVTGASVAGASPTNDDQSLQRGALEDMTPQQKYRSAIREAGGAYKESLRECAQAAGDDRQACIREAKATYDHDMAEAKLILRTWTDAGKRAR